MVLESNARTVWVGIGCRRGVNRKTIELAIEWVFTEYNLDLATIAGIATLDRKAEVVGAICYCRELGLFLKTYSPECLNTVTVARPSGLVFAAMGTASVAEAAALRAAKTDILLVPKQKFYLQQAAECVTVAVAQSDR